MKLYRHYKQKLYKYLGEARHSENEEQHVIYECLYPNPSGQIWIRPKSMFHEVIEHEGRRRPRFEPVELRITASEKLSPELEKEMKALMMEAFNEWNPEAIHSTLEVHPIYHLDMAYVEGRAVGFKIGYAKDRWTFYSWLGAVAQEFRGLGIAQALMAAQHDWCKNHRFSTVETKTLNRFRSMLMLNLKNGFEIYGTHTSSVGLKILLQKKLWKSARAVDMSFAPSIPKKEGAVA